MPGVKGETTTSLFSLLPNTTEKKPRLSYHINSVIKARCYMLFPLPQMHVLKCNFDRLLNALLKNQV